VYTKGNGWIDFKHFFAANSAVDRGEFVTNVGGLYVETVQLWENSPSAFSYEDLGSNASGANFGDDVFDPNGGPLSVQLSNFGHSLGPAFPTRAPNYTSIPDNPEVENSRSNQSAKGAAPPTATHSDIPIDAKKPKLDGGCIAKGTCKSTSTKN